VDLHRRIVDLPQQHGSEVERPDAIVAFLEPDVMFLEGVGEKEQSSWKRIVPACVTRLTRKCPGYSSGGRSAG
jgi:hypothetical protein